jgi:hypothetical protein
VRVCVCVCVSVCVKMSMLIVMISNIQQEVFECGHPYI